MSNNPTIQIATALPRLYGMTFPTSIDWTIREGEQWCVIGPNASGKTMLSDILTGRIALKSGSISYDFWTELYKMESGKNYPTEAIKKVAFESAYMLSDYKNMYYQQRFNALENEFTPTVEELMARVKEQEYAQWLCKKLHVDRLFNKHLIMLSSGELRRLLILLALVRKPKVIIFDNPFIGLDVQTREELDKFFHELKGLLQMIFLVPAANEIPSVTTNILKAENLTYEVIGSVEDYKKRNHTKGQTNSYNIGKFPSTPGYSFPTQYGTVLKMKNINISYNGRGLFKNLNWEIRRGEKWALLGQNGSGKSTLLSLLVADNPKAYALDISIFDRKRGSGESIWEIKKPIGYISSELHLYFHSDQNCLNIVASGFYDTIGLFRKCTEQQTSIASEWMRILTIEHLKDRSFQRLSSGEQRLVLLARTLVKNPDLLILDEPLHGLDLHHKAICRSVIEKFCEQKGKTLVYVTHRQEEIPSCVDHIFEIKNQQGHIAK